MNSFLGLLIIALILLVLFQVGRALDMINALRSEEEIKERNNHLQGTLFLVFMVLFLFGSIASYFYYQDRYLPEPVSVHGAEISFMFFWTTVATLPVFVATHIALFWFAYKYRNVNGRKPYYYSHNNRLELIWTVIPAAVMILLVFQGMRSWLKIMGDAPENAIVIEATAQQFQWNFRYSGADNVLGKKTVKNITTDNQMGQIWSDKANQDDFITQELHLPVGKPVLVRINSIDVLHSFYLPHFDVKMDAVPGIPTQFWFTPTTTTAEARKLYDNPEFEFEVACAELCGAAHYNMRRVAIVETEEEFNKWAKEQQPTYKALGLDEQELDNDKRIVEKEESEVNQTTDSSTL